MTPRALVLRTAGTNCDGETMHALNLCGASPELLHLREIAREPERLFQYSMMVIPGGFSYGDDVAAGRILANELKFKLAEQVRKFVREGRLVSGICNGFQALVKAGLLPGNGAFDLVQSATLTQNDSGRFQCQWVGMRKERSKAAWLRGFPKDFELPIAHGEGKFAVKDPKVLNQIEKNGQVLFRYHPENPNGSAHSIAGICNASGNVAGLMPHPERFVTRFQHPAWSRTKPDGVAPGLLFWRAAVEEAGKIK